MPDVTINLDQQLYVIACSGGYACLGFDVCIRDCNAIRHELGLPMLNVTRGSLDAYQSYRDAIYSAYAQGRALRCGLTPQLVGLERRRVEVVDCYDNKRRFWVGMSTGPIPRHLEIKTTRSLGGCAVMGTPFKSVHIVK